MRIRVRRKNMEPENVEKPAQMVVAEIITHSIEPKFSMLTGRKAKDCTNKNVYEKYFDVFDRIAKYLLEIRGNYKNSIESLAHDYLSSIYERYGYYNKTPFLTQLIPSNNNQIKFEQWIHFYEEEHDGCYWVEKDVYNRALEMAKKHVEMTKKKITEVHDNFDILEI